MVALKRSALKERAPAFAASTVAATIRKGGLKPSSTKRISKPLLRDNSVWHQFRKVDDRRRKNSPRLITANATTEPTTHLRTIRVARVIDQRYTVKHCRAINV